MLTKEHLPAFRLLLLAASLAAAAIYYGHGLLNHDPSYLLVATERWLNGATLYRDVVEINPPWVFYLTVPSVVAANLFGIPLATAFVVFVCTLAGTSLIWCWSLLARVDGLSLAGRYAIIVAAFAALMVTPAYNFGQREQLFIILALPYFFAMGFSPARLQIGSREKLALGVYALAGVALKPYFVIPVTLVTAALCWRLRSPRPLLDQANVSIAVGLLAYALLVATVHPAYFQTIVPFGLDVYGAVADDTANIPVRSVFPLVLIAAAATLSQRTPAIRDSMLAFSSVLLGLLLAFAIQRKEWDYQILPFDSMALIVAIIAIAVGGRRILSSPVQCVVLMTVPVVLLTMALRDGHYGNPYPEAFASSLEKVAPGWKGKSVVVLTTNVSAAFPFINEAGAEWVGKYPYQWLIAGARMRQSQIRCGDDQKFCAELDAILDFARGTNVDDFVSHSPDVVLVDVRATKSYMPDGPFDYIEFLDGDPRFREIWQSYRKVDTVFSYDIWLRSPRSAAAPGATSGG